VNVVFFSNFLDTHRYLWGEKMGFLFFPWRYILL